MQNEDDKHEIGVVIMTSKEGTYAILEWDATNDIIIWAEFKNRYYNIIIINVDAATNKNSDEQKRV